ncbi:hypothetical protein B0T24DRAFT_628211, partial [Lasiosphaeria ovina]
MSGSGGFYKYRCKYFLSNNCQNWVWVNYAACAVCLTEGRERDAGDGRRMKTVDVPGTPGYNRSLAIEDVDLALLLIAEPDLGDGLDCV